MKGVSRFIVVILGKVTIDDTHVKESISREIRRNKNLDSLNVIINNK
jgi:hypothetical protein